MKTKIEWVRNPDGSQGYTHNPMSGCRNHTPEGLCLGGLFPCYAWKLVQGRLKPLYLANKVGLRSDLFRFPDTDPCSAKRQETWLAVHDPFYPRFWEERLAEMTKRNDRLYYDGEKTKYAISPRGIFVCDMGDLFGVGVPEQWTEKVLDEIWGNKGYDRFYILTKQAQRLPEFSPFPDNAWVGVTATSCKMLLDALWELQDIQAKVKYLSLEPLLDWTHSEKEPNDHIGYIADWIRRAGINWLIIGACTGTLNEMQALRLRNPELSVKLLGGNKWTAQPRIEWVREIVEAADQAGIPVFLKENIVPLIAGKGTPEGLFYKDCWLRQEMPERR